MRGWRGPGLGGLRLLAAAWRGVRSIVAPAREGLALWLAARRRRRLSEVVFIGVTGSAGKTTTKELIAAVLSSRFQGRKNRGSRNDMYEVARTILAVRRGDRFCVQEIAAGLPKRYGSLPEEVALLAPRIGVVTNIGHDHRSIFRTLQATAEAKSVLIGALPAAGTAILNADDPLVLGMRSRAAGRVITFGLAPDAMVRAEGVRSAWPERLAFTLRYEDQVLPVRTQLCGTHWASPVLAAVATGLAMGVPLEAAVQAVAAVPPTEGRMCPVSHPDGVTFIRDDWKASPETIEPALSFMEQARAQRKIVVIGTLSDYAGDARDKYLKVARRALDVADHVVFVGPRALSALRAMRTPEERRLRAFTTIRAAVGHLQPLWRPGDLVLLKGSGPADHLARIVLVRTARVRCWLTDCNRRILCDRCRLLRVPGGPGGAANVAVPDVRLPVAPSGARSASAEAGVRQAVVGLGNPGDAYRDTRHNVGHRVLDRLAGALDREWSHEGEAMIVHAEWRGAPVCLVKLSAFVHAMGPALARLAARLGVEPGDLVLVHDDMDLPVGGVRTRMRGSAGGHRHLRSVLETFQTDAIRRVKVGIGRPVAASSGRDHVLAAFSEAEVATIDSACAVAAERVLSLIASRASRASRG